jgi:cytochrome c biogenesis protein CcmG, thiol:disulfide interchange protein DsbE
MSEPGPGELAEVDPAAGGAPVPSGSVPATTASVLQRRGRLLLVGVAALALAALFWPRGDARKEAPGGFLVDAGGRPAPLGERLAPVTLLHFYATWCPPCLDEAPSLQRLESDFASEPRFHVVKVAVQDDVAKAQKLAGSEDVLFDPDWKTAHRYGTRQLPESYLLVDGKVQRKFDGPVDWDDAQVREAVKLAISRAR